MGESVLIKMKTTVVPQYHLPTKTLKRKADTSADFGNQLDQILNPMATTGGSCSLTIKPKKIKEDK